MKKQFYILFSGIFLTLFSSAFAQESEVFTQEEIPDDFTYELIADRLSCIEKEVPLSYSTRVYAFINYFTVKNRDYTRGVLKRTPYYFPIFEKTLARHGLPDELKYLAIVESGLQPRAMSPVGAGGLWQFMPYTGRSFKLHQDWYIDERFDPEQASEAAARYLKSLYNMFGDWELALAAYNSGPGNVRKAMRRSGYKRTFNEIYSYLPRETRFYVPQFVAIAYTLNYADEHNLHVEDPIYEMAYDTVQFKGFVNLQILAESLNICYSDIEVLNPSFKRYGLLSERVPYPVKLPAETVAEVRAHKDSLQLIAGTHGKKELAYQARNTPGSTFGRDRVVYRVRSGDVLGSIAQRYKVRVSDIRKWNNLSSNLIRVGQRLNIWVYPGSAPTTASSSNTTATPFVDTSGRKVYIVQPGDTLWDIARKNEGLDIEKLKKLNNLKSSQIKPGQKLIVG